MDEEPSETPAPQAPEEPPEPEQEQRENPLLIVGLRIVLVALVVFVCILIVGKYLVAKADLKETPGSTSGTGAIPVNPILPSQAPTASPTPSASTYPSLPTLSGPPAPTDVPPPDSVPPGLNLSITPRTVGSGATFTVTGTYAGRDGVSLWLQSLVNGNWQNYPNDITVTMGTFSTTAESTISGTNTFRVYDQSTGLASNLVSILVR